MCIKRLFKTECSVSPSEGFLGFACHTLGQRVWCTAPGIYFSLHGNLLWNSDFSVLSGRSWQEMSFMNANDMWLEPATQLFSLQRGRGFIRSVPASHVSFPTPHRRFWRRSKRLCRISLGSKQHLEVLGQKFPRPPQIHQCRRVSATASRIHFTTARWTKVLGGKRGSNQRGFVGPLCRKAWWQWAGLMEGSSPLPGQTDRHTHTQ